MSNKDLLNQILLEIRDLRRQVNLIKKDRGIKDPHRQSGLIHEEIYGYEDPTLADDEHDEMLDALDDLLGLDDPDPRPVLNPDRLMGYRDAYVNGRRQRYDGISEGFDSLFSDL